MLGASPRDQACTTRCRFSMRGQVTSSCWQAAGTIPLTIHATFGLSNGEELEVSLENSSGISSWQRAASNSLVAVIVISASFLAGQRARNVPVPHAVETSVPSYQGLEPPALKFFWKFLEP